MAINVHKKLTEEELVALVLHKFFHRRAFAKYHIYESDVPKGFPKHIRSDILKTAKELRRNGHLTAFPHGRELVWQLNMKNIDEIITVLKKHYPEEFT